MMMEEGNSCLFRDVVDICSIEKVYESNELTETRRQKIIESSHQRMDAFASQLNENKKYHTQCYLYYTSKQKIKRHVEKESSTTPKQPPAKKKL